MTPEARKEIEQVSQTWGKLSDGMDGKLLDWLQKTVDVLKAVKGDKQAETQILETIEETLTGFVGEFSQAAQTVADFYMADANEQTGAYTSTPLSGVSSGYSKELNKIVHRYAGKSANYWRNLSPAKLKKIASQIRTETIRTGNKRIASIARRSGEYCALVPRGERTCAFCDMLHSREYAYTAQHAPNTHEHCHCVLVPETLGNEMGLDFSAAKHRYRTARTLFEHNSDKTPTDNDITELMRHLYRNAYTDIDTTLEKVKVYGDGTITELDYYKYLRLTTEKYLREKNTLPKNAKLPPLQPYEVPQRLLETLEKKNLHISTAQWNHILIGEYREGNKKLWHGGHLYGYGWIANTNSEFNKDSDPDGIAQLLCEFVNRHYRVPRFKKYIEQIQKENTILVIKHGTVASFYPIGGEGFAN